MMEGKQVDSNKDLSEVFVSGAARMRHPIAEGRCPMARGAYVVIDKLQSVAGGVLDFHILDHKHVFPVT